MAVDYYLHSCKIFSHLKIENETKDEDYVYGISFGNLMYLDSCLIDMSESSS